MTLWWRQICTSLALMALTQAPHAQSVEDTFRAFTACDAGLFQSIAHNKPEWRKHADLSGNESVAWISTPDRQAVGGNVRALSTPPEVAGLPLTHYVDESEHWGSNSHLYRWGFKVMGSLAMVANKLTPLVLDKEHLLEDEGGYLRTELKFSGKPWLPLTTPSSAAPQPLTVTRTLTLEKDPALPNTVQVLCTLQGDVSAEVLQTLRPDIDPKEYPATLDPELFGKVQLGDAVLQAVQQTTRQSPLWLPKFKRIRYAYASNGSENSVVVENMGNGLLEATENYNLFTVHRQTLAGLVQTKSRFNDSGSVALTQSISLNLPSTIRPGDTLGFQLLGQSAPAQADAQTWTMALQCTAGKAFDAADIFETLPGRAIRLRCYNEKNEARSKVLLESLGLVIDYTPSSSIFSSAKPQYTQFSIEH